MARRIRGKSDEEGESKVIRSVGFHIHTEAIEEKKHADKRSESVPPSVRRAKDTNEDYGDLMGRLLKSALETGSGSQAKNENAKCDTLHNSAKTSGTQS
jgi:hypothetical protein